MENVSPLSIGRGQRIRQATSRFTYDQLGNPRAVQIGPIAHSSRQPIDELVNEGNKQASTQVDIPIPKPRKSLTIKSNANRSVRNEEQKKDDIRELEDKADLSHSRVKKELECQALNARLEAINAKINLFSSIKKRELTEEEHSELLSLEFEKIDVNSAVKVVEAELWSMAQNAEIRVQTLEEIHRIRNEKNSDEDSSNDEIPGDFRRTAKWVDDHQKHGNENPPPHFPGQMGVPNFITTNEAAKPDEDNQQGASAMPPVFDDKLMMVQLMQKQLELMQRPSGDTARIDKELPAFSGGAEDWAAFVAEYNRTTKQYDVKPSENLRRLRKSLKGKAMDVVKSLMANPNNVDEIMSTLHLHFGRPEQIIRILIKKARETKSPKVNKPETWITYAIAVQSLVVNIKTFCSDGRYLNDSFLLEELVEKLPVQLRKEWILWVRANQLYLPENQDSFRTWMNIQRETACTISRWEEKEPPDEAGNLKKKRGAGVHVAVESDSCCKYCDKQHKIAKCFAFKKLKVDERWEAVKEKRLCFCCLQDGHVTTSCPESKSCGKDGCDKRHHPLLHQARSGRRSPPLFKNNRDINEDVIPEEDESQAPLKVFPSTLQQRQNVCQSSLLTSLGLKGQKEYLHCWIPELPAVLSRIKLLLN
ncbi:unnamed protein product [Orchesella dallaii]|uniref:CCHC-type domain-containing protein n=1 Tax=Orchesella dallaii TaxID=48710 RepID=A0ABP1RJC5_9HEXA